MFAEYPGAVISCVMQRTGDLGGYLKELTEDGTNRLLTLTDADVSVPGQVQIQLRATISANKYKSAIYTATVGKSLVGEADAPDSPVSDTLDKLEDALAKAQNLVTTVQTKLDNGEFDGEDFRILGTYATVDALTAAVTNPAQGDFYNVGAAAPYKIYMWDADKGWVDQGQLQGPTGAHYTPAVSASGELTWSNDAGLENPAAVNIMGPKGDPGDKGEPGEQGKNGVIFTPNVNNEGVISWSNDGDLENPAPVSIKGVKGDIGEPGSDGVSPTVVINKTGSVTTIAITDKNGEHVATINDGADGAGSGDMSKAVYDTNNDGIVDNAARLGGQLPAYYAKASDLAGKVSAVSGKGLSTNDYTTAEKEKLAGIEAGAQKNVTPAWDTVTDKPESFTPAAHTHTQNDISGLATALAGKVTAVGGKGLSTNDYTADDKAKLTGIETGAQKNVQADWNATSGDALIKNKPTIPTKTSELTNDSGFVASSDIPTWAKEASKPTYTAAEVGAAPTAHTHAYSDLTGKPTIPAIYAYTVTLTAAGWDSTALTQTVAAAHVTADNLVQVSPAEASFEVWQAAQIRCSAQAAENLTFICGGDVPTEAVTYNVIVMDGVTA